jgi:hypothetical protein
MNACHSLDASTAVTVTVTAVTTVTKATSNINIMTAHNSRNTSNSTSNNRTANTVWMPSKAGMLAKTVKGRPSTTRMPK